MGMNNTTRKQMGALRRRRLALALVGALTAPAAFGQSLPDTGNVVSGTASVNQVGNQMTITQTSQGAIIDWGSFNIAAGYGVNFDQQYGVSSVTLNRVTGGTTSLIDGMLGANGSVFIINPAGITFSGSSQVNVGALVASTMEISNANFTAGVASGSFQFDPMTDVGNQAITLDVGADIATAAGGTVALIGRQIFNQGTITAPGGSVLFGSAENVTLDFQGDGLTMLTIQGPGIAKPGTGPCPSFPCPGPILPTLVNSGTVSADGGQILMRTAASALGGGDIINAGTLRAQSLVSRSGRIELTTDGVVSLGYSLPSASSYAGTLDVSGQAGASGGTVLVRASDFAMFNDDAAPLNPTNPASVGSVIDASGAVNGGVVDILVSNLAQVYSLSSILANGAAGQGGQVSLVAGTAALGARAQISANGGAGAGGRIDVSGSDGLSLFGRLSARGTTAGGIVNTSTEADSFDLRGLQVDAGSPVAAGTWTLSAPNLTVINGSDAGELDAMLGGTYLQDAEINRAFANGTSVVLRSTSDLYFDDAQILASSSLPLSFAANADGRISGSNFSIIADTGSLEMRFNSNASGLQPNSGGIDFGSVTIDSNGGDVLMYGQSDQVNGYASDDLNGIHLYGSDIRTGGGDLLLRGTSTGMYSSGEAGVFVYQTPIDAGIGNVTMIGRGAQDAYGVNLTGDSVLLQAGSVDIDGIATGTGTGVLVSQVGLITSAGDIRIDGEGGGTGVSWSSYSGLHANGGDIVLHGTGDSGNGLDMRGSMDTDGGAISLQGSSGQAKGVYFYLYTGGIASSGGDIDMAGDGVTGGIELAGYGFAPATIDSAGGAFQVAGTASGSNAIGVALSAIQLTTGSGDIGLTGISTNGTSIGFSGSSLTTTTGDIQLVGVGLDVGLSLYGGAISTGSGHLDLRGRGLAAASEGLVIGSGTSLITNGGGIELSGEGGSGAGVRIDGFSLPALVDAGNSLVVVRAANDGSSDAIRIDGEIHSGMGVNLRPGGVDANGVAYERTADGILIGTGNGFALSGAELANVFAPELVIGSSQHAGAIQVVEAITRAGNLTLQNGGGSGGIDLQAGLDVGSYTLALASGGNITQTASAVIRAHSLLASAGGDVLLATAQNDVASTTLAGTAGGNFQFEDSNDLAIGSVAASGFDTVTGGMTSLGAVGISAGGDVSVRNLVGNLTLNAGISATNIDLVTAGTLQNAGSAALSATGSWRVWANTWVGEARGGLAGSGTLPNLYGCVYLGACGVTVTSGDSHFIYAQQPTAVITIDDALREYGLANPTFTFSVNGLVLGDTAANAISGSALTTAVPGSDVGTYAITGGFTSAAGYLVQFNPATLTIAPATLLFTANPFFRFLGDDNPALTGSISGFRNGDTAQSVFGNGLLWFTSAGPFSPVGYYAIAGGTSAKNYVFAQAPGNATALQVIPRPQAPDTPIDIVRETPNTYVYDRNFGGTPACAMNASLQDQPLASAGDTLASEWSKVRSRPNLTNCFDSERRSGCGDF